MHSFCWFEWQKSPIRDDIISQQNNGKRHNPVTVAAQLIRRMIAMGLSDEALISAYRATPQSRTLVITSAMAIELLRTDISGHDYKADGLSLDRIGLHSLRSSGAMAMYLNKVPVPTIMLLGRWSSDAFLRYIRKQIQQFSNGISLQMTKSPMFHYIQFPEALDPRPPVPLVASANTIMADSLAPKLSAFSVWK
jgi:hypothetical protein